MCQGFGAIITQDNLYFCEPDDTGYISHAEIITRLGWHENTDPFLRLFVRVECADWTMQSFRFDETGTLPGWIDEDQQRERVEKTLERVAPAWETYEAVRAPAWETYEAVHAQALEAYKAVRDPAWEKLRETLKSISGYVPA